MKTSRKNSKRRSGKLKKVAKRLAAYSAAAAATVMTTGSTANATEQVWNILDITVTEAGINRGVFFNMINGSTFGGNPLCCAAACAAIDYMVEHRLDEQAAAKGAALIQRIRDAALPIVREVRGLGLMIGIELRMRVKPYVLELLDRGVITLPAGATVIRLLPPLTISDEDIDAVVNTLLDVLGNPSH